MEEQKAHGAFNCYVFCSILFYLTKYFALTTCYLCWFSWDMKITSSLKGIDPFEVIGLHMEEENKVDFGVAVSKAWKSFRRVGCLH